MADQKITELTEVTSLSDSDFFAVVVDVGTAPITKKVKKSNAITGGGDMVLAGVQTVTGAKTFNDAKLLLAGLTSGASTLKAPAIASTYVHTLPAATDTIAGITATQTLTNKRITRRTGTVASSATPTINTDNVDFFSITALAADITSMSTNLSGTPTEGQILHIAFTDNGTARAIVHGASFEASTIPLATITVISTRLDEWFVWNSVTSKWRLIGKA